FSMPRGNRPYPKPAAKYSRKRASSRAPPGRHTQDPRMQGDAKGTTQKAPRENRPGRRDTLRRGAAAPRDEAQRTPPFFASPRWVFGGIPAVRGIAFQLQQVAAGVGRIRVFRPLAIPGVAAVSQDVVIGGADGGFPHQVKEGAKAGDAFRHFVRAKGDEKERPDGAAVFDAQPEAKQAGREPHVRVHGADIGGYGHGV